MQYSAVAVLAIAATASAHYSNNTEAEAVAYVTDVVTDIVTFCPEAAVLTFGHTTYTVSASQTLTIPGTHTFIKPAPSAGAPPNTPAAPPVVLTNKPAAPVYPTYNTTVGNPAPPAAPPAKQTPPVKQTPNNNVTTSGAGKAFVLSGASLAGLLGLAAFLL